jgi:hypothetical protein
MNTTRRSLITGLIALVAAPAIVRAGSLMPVKQMLEPAVVDLIEPFTPRWATYDIYPPQAAKVGDLVRINGEGWWVRDMMDYGRRLVLEEFC